MTAYNVVNAAAMVAGQPEDISVVKSNFDAIAAVINGSLDNANISPAAGIVYSKLNLALAIQGSDIANGAITDAKVNAAAAILLSKLAGYPADATKFARGDGTWAVPAAGVVPATHKKALQFGSAIGVFPVASTAYLLPIIDLNSVFSFTRFGFQPTTASGNMDLGIYSSTDEVTFTRLFSTASFAVPAAGITYKVVASQTLTPVAGTRWYIGVACDNTTAAFRVGDSTYGGYSKATSFPLPATLTAMTAMQGANVPQLALLI